ncbi:MAG: type 4b pilus protein PilO2 [Alphaproteobacteria bacterium]|nr:type 4b pilus protein PilO2 [Alphaproteobacteria bacterium]
MANGLITVDRKKYAVGLFWQPLPVGQNPHNFAKQLSKQISGSVKFYTEFRSMVGIGSRALRHRRGMKIAAIEVINHFSEYNSFLAEFFTPQGFWIIGVRNNIIIFDKLISSESDAKKEFANLTALPDWDIIIASGSWNVPGAIEKPLRSIITGISKQNLIPISSAFGNILSLIIFCIAAFGIWYLFSESIIEAFAPRAQQVQINQQVLEEYKRQLAEKKEELKEIEQPEVVPMPYDNLPDPYLRADQCWRSIGFVMQPISGWIQQSVICDNYTVKAIFNRTYGTLENLYNSINSLMGEQVSITENTDSNVIININLTPLQSVENNHLKHTSKDIIFYVNNAFQKIGELVNIRSEIETVGQGDIIKTVNIVIANTNSKLKPDEFIKIFDGLSPMFLSSVKWDARSRTWNYEVKIYAK